MCADRKDTGSRNSLSGVPGSGEFQNTKVPPRAHLDLYVSEEDTPRTNVKPHKQELSVFKGRASPVAGVVLLTAPPLKDESYCVHSKIQILCQAQGTFWKRVGEEVRAGEGWSGVECVFRAGVAVALLNSAAVIAAQDRACQHSLVRRGGCLFQRSCCS